MILKILDVTLNPYDKTSSVSLSNNKLSASGTPTTTQGVRATHGKTSGKWYWEFKLVSGEIAVATGISNKDFDLSDQKDRGNSGNILKYKGIRFDYSRIVPEYVDYGGGPWAVGNVVGVALDMDNGTLEFIKNGVRLGISHTGLKELGEVYPTFRDFHTRAKTVTFNFGATPFVYPIPNGFIAYNIEYENKILLSRTLDEKIKGIKKGILSTTNAIPVMRSNTLPSGVVSTNSEIGGNVAWRAFDDIDTSNSYWQSLNNSYPIYLEYEFEKQKRIGSYALIVHSAAYSPKNWTFEGSINGVTWDVLDAQSTALVANVLTTFNLNKTGRYKKYRLNITATNGATTTMISGFRMYEIMPDIIVNLPSISEQNFINYGADSPLNLDIYSNIIDIVSDNTVLGSGKTYEHDIDLSKRKTNKISFQ
ncbi:MAG: SPRY domain-containing protein [Bacillota bacterium]